MTPPCRALAVLSLLLSLVFAPRASSAEPADPKPTAAADAVGRVHFQRGQRLSASGNYAGAYREFAAGYAATRRPLFLFNMGEAARANGDVARARESYLEFLRVDPNSALAATARTRLAELDRVSGTSQSGTSQSATSQSGISQSGTSQSGTSQSATSRTGTSPTGAAPTGAAPTGTAPSTSAVTTTPGPTRADLLPLQPPSAVPPRPTRPSSDDGLPPDRFTTERDTESRPLWKKWPFWAVVGVGAIAGGAIVYAATRPGGNACSGDCTPLNFRSP
jgi:hypothetical protein